MVPFYAATEKVPVDLDADAASRLLTNSMSTREPTRANRGRQPRLDEHVLQTQATRRIHQDPRSQAHGFTWCYLQRVFGFGRNLHKVGVRAYAEILSADQTPVAISIGNPNLLNNTQIRWHLRLRVLPEGEPPFDASVHALLPQLNRPRPGTRVAVLYDPANHSKVELDHQPISAAGDAGDAIIGNRPDLAEAEVMGMPMTDLIRQAIADPSGFRDQMMQRGAAMQQQALSALQASSSQTTQAQPATPPPSDPIDRLERLAALKDRGLITDEEFAQQKSRILGET